MTDGVMLSPGGNPTIRLRSGFVFDLAAPETSPVLEGDIAHALGHICRFTGHTREFYSVAQHSVLVSHLVPPADARAALFHDAAEAFAGDVSRPLKRLLPDYAAVEARIEAHVRKQLGLPADLPQSVKDADLMLLKAEGIALMGDDFGLHDVPDLLPGVADSLAVRWPPAVAVELFLWRLARIEGRE